MLEESQLEPHGTHVQMSRLSSEDHSDIGMR